ncbi:MAG: cytochrome c3 family protein [Coriobacteriia bacterium]|nr:cytochrome c3 family protein [Coriobacteriia bacterium]
MSEEIKNQDENQPEVTEAAPATPAEPSAKKTVSLGKLTLTRGKFAACVIALVVVVAGIGGFAWHNTPGFCGTMCHTTMSYYSDSYASDDTTLAYRMGHVSGKATDTLRDGVSDSNKACLDCHPASIGEQIKELGMTIDGDYTLTEDGKLVIEDGHFKANKEFCTQCHDYEKVIAKTANYNGGKHDSESGVFNPHASHQGDLACGTCHNVHGTSVMYCTSCHNAEVPEGWVTVAQAQEMNQQVVAK